MRPTTNWVMHLDTRCGLTVESPETFRFIPPQYMLKIFQSAFLSSVQFPIKNLTLSDWLHKIKNRARSVCVCILLFQYLIEFLKWSSAGFFTVQLLSNHRSASVGSSKEREKAHLFLQNAITSMTKKENLELTNEHIITKQIM